MEGWEVERTDASVEISRWDRAVRIRLRRPEHMNALDAPAMQTLLATLGDLRSDAGVGAVLLTGEGRAFSAGADVRSEFGPERSAGDIEERIAGPLNAMVIALRRLPKPVIAAVNGPAVGMGCSIALACDLVVSAESAYFLLPFSRLGLTLDGGASLTVAARVGLGRAASMALLAERVGAADAHRWGLVDVVTPDAELAATAERLTHRLARGPTRAFAATKTLLNASTLRLLAEQLDLEHELQGPLLRSAEFRAAVGEFGDRAARPVTGPPVESTPPIGQGG